MVKEILFTKNTTKNLVKFCQGLITWFAELDTSAGISYKQMSYVINSIMSCESVFAYLYTEEYKYGNIADIIDTRSEDFAKYTLAASLVFSEPNGLKKSIKKLSSLWNNITNVLEDTGLDYNKRPDEINKAIDSIVDAVNILSSNHEN